MHKDLGFKYKPCNRIHDTTRMINLVQKSKRASKDKGLPGKSKEEELGRSSEVSYS
jgi:hypothetical protein